MKNLNFLNKITKNRLYTFPNNTSFFFSLLIGFFGGNLFSTCALKYLFLPPSIIIVGIFCCIEYITYLYYKPIKKKQKRFIFGKQNFLPILRYFNLFKIGILFGLFVDAFKVGS